MKNRQISSIQIPGRIDSGRSRAHAILFDHDSPFRPQKVMRKDLYQRRPKHIKKQELA